MLQGVGLAGALAGISPFLAACDSASNGSASKISTDELKIAIGGQPNSLDADKFSVGADYYFVLNVYERLSDYDASGKQIPAIAAELPSVSSDGRVYTFKLRKDVKFHDGSPVTAEDVKFSYERFVDPKVANPFAFLLKKFDKAVIVDPSTIEIHLKEPDVGFLPTNACAWIVPKAYIEKVGDAEFAKAPIGTGPLKFVSHQLNKNFVLERFDDYWGDKPAFKLYTFNIIPDNTARVTALKSGQVQLISAIPPQQLKSLEKNLKLVIKSKLDGDDISIKINCLPNQAGKPWMDPKVRQALDLAINRDELLEKVLLGQAQKEAFFQPPNASFAAGEKAGIKPRKYDLDKARSLLKEAGFAKGFDLPFSGVVNGRLPNSSEVAQAIAGYWTELGINVDLKMHDYSAWISSIKPGTTFGAVFNMYGDSLNGPNARFSGMYRSGGTYTLINDAKLDQLLDAASASVGTDQIDANYVEVAKYLSEQAYVLPLFALKGSYGMAKGLDWAPWKSTTAIRASNAKPQ